MGKGYNNYMCKKPFHPGSKSNIKRAWMAEQRTENEKKKQDELRLQYEKEQDLYNNKALLSKESKGKLSLNFMYEAPPGAKRERQKEDDEPEYKFEWQRKYNAPREDFAKENKDIRDQPFGISVRNVCCIKCHKWGHINTDKECPLYNQASTSSMPKTSMDPLELMRQMREDGLVLKHQILGPSVDLSKSNQQLVPSDDEEDAEMKFLKSLPSKQKKKLLKKLNKLAKAQEGGNEKSHKKKKKSKGSDHSDSEHEHRRREGKNLKKPTVDKRQKASDTGESSDCDSNSEEQMKEKSKKRKHKKRKRKASDTGDSSDSNSSDSEEQEKERRKKRKHKRRKHNSSSSVEENLPARASTSVSSSRKKRTHSRNNGHEERKSQKDH